MMIAHIVTAYINITIVTNSNCKCHRFSIGSQVDPFSVFPVTGSRVSSIYFIPTSDINISTIHSDSTAGVYARLINMDIEPFLLASSITGVLGLRLLRTICPRCKTEDRPNPEHLSLLPEGFVEETAFYTGAGCDACSQTGYHGRVAVTELLNSSELVREGVIQKLRTSKLHDIAIEQGMTTLWQNAMAKVQRGITSLEEVVRVISINQV